MTSTTIVRLEDYCSFPWQIPAIFLDIRVHSSEVIVISELLCKAPADDIVKPLQLYGVDLELDSIAIDDKSLEPADYHFDGAMLTVFQHLTNTFHLRTRCRINPFHNSSLEGLYASGSMLSTQCEAQGFRRITFHPDRPDVLSQFRVRIEADRDSYPVLLSNGNLISSELVESNPSRHVVVWDDPFPKPSYLFALVAGNLKEVRSHFTTLSGRKVTLRLHVEPGDEPYTLHAMESLKRSMAWDEHVYGLEYDLDEFNTVAVRHFNMGAMENKSLNIFNSKLILADAETATDSELERIESVVAHEYFHNWSGNRVTCRDWFQLSLKEGLTVFRDQCFSADLHSEPLKRIEDVSFLRNTQFREDAGPTAHPVKPGSYQAIDNFYTTTIYEKGAEIIRMLQILLGQEKFIAGVGNYFQCYDGTAATTEDFVSAVVDSTVTSREMTCFDREQFERWYYQAGTPHVYIKRTWDPDSGTLKLKLRQHTPSTPGQPLKEPLVIPVLWALIGCDGRIGEERLLVMNHEEEEIVVVGLPREEQPPALSLFRRFSAPVTWNIKMEESELFHLLARDDDSFARWDAAQCIWKRLLLARAGGVAEASLEQHMATVLEQLLEVNGELDSGILATLMSFPGSAELEAMQEQADPLGLYMAASELREAFGNRLAEPLQRRLQVARASLAQLWPRGQHERRLAGVIWSWLAAAGDLGVRRESLEAVKGPSMTLSRAALRALQPIDCPERDEAQKLFHDRWLKRPVIFDSWFALEASTPRREGLERVAALLRHPCFDPKVPSTVRAVLGGLASNPPVFHSEDGSGYRFMAEQIATLDKRNPITASRLVKVFSSWRSYAPVRQHHIWQALKKLATTNLSINTLEIVTMLQEGQVPSTT